jgi:formylmethanofuran dehydrogenase subunit E
MTLWMVTPISGGRVAIRIRNPGDRARRVVMDSADAEEAREEWRCSRCGEWFPRETVKLVHSGRAVAGVPEIAPYCGPCDGQSRVRRRP